jgi:hypothetical protein
MEDASYEQHNFLDAETGEVNLVSVNDNDEESSQRLEALDEAEPGRYLRVHVANRAAAGRMGCPGTPLRRYRLCSPKRGQNWGQ